MKDFYGSIGSIIIFLVAVLLFQTFLGKKAATMGLGLILIGQLLFNPEIVQKFKFTGPIDKLDPSSGHGGILAKNNKQGGGVMLL